MAMTGVLMPVIFVRRRRYRDATLAWNITLLDRAFPRASLRKRSTGGYWSIVLGTVPLTVILIYLAGQRQLNQEFQPVQLLRFLR